MILARVARGKSIKNAVNKGWALRENFKHLFFPVDFQVGKI